MESRRVLLLLFYLLVVCYSSVLVVTAFTPPFRSSSIGRRHPARLAAPLPTASTSTMSTILSMSPEERPSADVKKDEKPAFDEGSHDELIYALGVNLARQLGDVRPLCESGAELAVVAKGLVDTVIGQLDEDGQRALLQRRGKELNQLVAQLLDLLRKATPHLLQSQLVRSSTVRSNQIGYRLGLTQIHLPVQKGP